MTEGPAKFDDLDAEEQQAFFDLADEFIYIANGASDAEAPRPVVAAAFLYSCARYNAFSMQLLGNTPTEIDEEIVAYLVDDFDTKLREHMSQRVTDFEADDAALPSTLPVIAALDGLESLDDDEHSEFLDLADRFIHAANALIRSQRSTRISAAFSYGCARFNAFVLQAAGFPAGQVDDAAVAALRDAYESTLRMHMEETLVKPNA